MNKYFKYSFVVTCCSFLTCAAANGMTPFVPANPAQYSESTPRQDRHPFDPSSVSTTESVTEELPPRLQPLPFTHQQNAMGYMQQFIQLMNTENPATFTWNFTLNGNQITVIISNHRFNNYKFSVHNVTTGDIFAINNNFGRCEVEGQGPYSAGKDIKTLYLYTCEDCANANTSVLPHVYICTINSCGQGINCTAQTKGGPHAHRGYCTLYGHFHYPQRDQLIYKFDCNVAREICEAYENGTLRQDTLPPCPLDLFYHQ